MNTDSSFFISSEEWLILHHIIWCRLIPYSYIHTLIGFIGISDIFDGLIYFSDFSILNP